MLLHLEDSMLETMCEAIESWTSYKMMNEPNLTVADFK